MQINDHRIAFERAIKQGRLSTVETSAFYVGHFMYIGTKDGHDLFKHVDTRAYLSTRPCHAQPHSIPRFPPV